jgi:hypothetical protein
MANRNARWSAQDASMEHKCAPYISFEKYKDIRPNGVTWFFHVALLLALRVNPAQPIAFRVGIATINFNFESRPLAVPRPSVMRMRLVQLGSIHIPNIVDS